MPDIDLKKQREILEKKYNEQIDNRSLASYLMYPKVFDQFIDHRKKFSDTSILPTLNKGAGVQLMKIKEKDCIIDTSLFDLKEGLFWNKGSKLKSLKDIDFWIGKRAQVGKKIPKGFNKNLKFNS